MHNLILLILLAGCIVVAAQDESCPERGYYALEQGRICRKPCSTAADCKKKPCRCDTECGLSCFNQDSDCLAPEDIENGQVEYDHTRWGGRASYSCDPGYSLQGARERKCNADKKWGGPAPVCRGVCDRPRDAPYSYSIEDPFFVGGSFEFVCNEGYYMTGSASRECLQGQTWSEALYECLPQHCDPIGDIPNGVVVTTSGMNFGSTATVQCDIGYESSSPKKSMRCYSGESGSVYGEWVGRLPTCQIISCERPMAPEDGSIRDIDYITLKYGTQIQYECDEGYKLKGSETGRCNEDREWGEVPTCIVDPDCDFSDSTCGYTPTNWRRTETIVSAGYSGFAARSTSGNAYLVSKELPAGWTDDFMCLTFQYKLPRGNEGILKIERSNDGEVLWKTHKKEVRTQWHDAAISLDAGSGLWFQFHASVSDIYLEKVTASLQECVDHCESSPCRNGGTCYNRIDGRTCFCTRQYKGIDCQIEITCPFLKSGDGARIRNPQAKWTAGNVARFECYSGLVSWNGESSMAMWMECSSSGEWQGEPPTCIRPYCTYRHSDGNTSPRVISSLSRYAVGSKIYFTCILGYELHGGSELECIEMGRWDGNFPTCQKVECQLPDLGDGFAPVQRGGPYYFGTSLTIGCRSNWFIDGDDGPRVITCQWNGQWSAVGNCLRFGRCDKAALNAPQNGSITTQSSNQVTYFECNELHCMNGYFKMRCGSENEWHGKPPLCEECPTATTTAGGFEFLAFTEEKWKSNYSNAQQLCRSIDANLALLYYNPTRRLVKENLLNGLGDYHSMYIGLKYDTSSRSFDWDIHDIPSTLPENWKEGSDTNWQTHKPQRRYSRRCAVVERIGGTFSSHEWRNVDCDDKMAILCQRDVKPCRPNPCQNGGTCRTEGDGYSCKCKERFKGRRCQTKILCDFSGFTEKSYKQLEESQFSVGDVVPLICEDGFSTASRVRDANCLGNGEWNIDPPRCEKITCGNPVLPDRASLLNPPRNGHKAGDFWYLICERGYQIVDTNIVQCNKDGAWLPANIRRNSRCEVKTCDVPHVPDNAKLARPAAESYDYGSVVRMACRPGFESRNAEVSLTCGDNKKWNPPESTLDCRKRETTTTTATTTTTTEAVTDSPCELPQIPQFSYIVGDVEDFPSGTKITLACSGDRSLTGGDNQWRCNDGEWRKTNVKCITLFCTVEPFLMSEGVTIEGVTSGELGSKRFEINTDYELQCSGSLVPTHYEDSSISPTIRCTGEGQWDPDYGSFDCV